MGRNTDHSCLLSSRWGSWAEQLLTRPRSGGLRGTRIADERVRPVCPDPQLAVWRGQTCRAVPRRWGGAGVPQTLLLGRRWRAAGLRAAARGRSGHTGQPRTGPVVAGLSPGVAAWANLELDSGWCWWACRAVFDACLGSSFCHPGGMGPKRAPVGLKIISFIV